MPPRIRKTKDLEEETKNTNRERVRLINEALQSGRPELTPQAQLSRGAQVQQQRERLQSDLNLLPREARQLQTDLRSPENTRRTLEQGIRGLFEDVEPTPPQSTEKIKSLFQAEPKEPGKFSAAVKDFLEDGTFLDPSLQGNINEASFAPIGAGLSGVARGAGAAATATRGTGIAARAAGGIGRIAKTIGSKLNTGVGGFAIGTLSNHFIRPTTDLLDFTRRAERATQAIPDAREELAKVLSDADSFAYDPTSPSNNYDIAQQELDAIDDLVNQMEESIRASAAKSATISASGAHWPILGKLRKFRTEITGIRQGLRISQAARSTGVSSDEIRNILGTQ